MADLTDFSNASVDLDGKSILVTGGTGSFGQKFLETVLNRHKVRKLVVFSRDEFKQHQMAQKFTGEQYDAVRYFLGDVRDRDRLEMAMRGIDIVVHAAALKHIPAAEYNPFECIHTNVLGAENIVNAAIRVNVKQVIALSTDKAANPTNLYGASKLAADKIFIAANSLGAATNTYFSVVRYGNVLGSRGSVVPFFTDLARNGAASLPITDDRMTRFWITLRQSVDFVLSSLITMRGGEILVPKLPTILVTDLAKAIAPDLPHEIIGIRPGEKLHEILITEHDAHNTLDLGDRYVIEPFFPYWHRESLTDIGGRPIEDGFAYSSDNNEQRLGLEAVQGILRNVIDG